MIVDALSIPQASLLEADICIIGAGAAGISMALELGDKGLKIILIESGKLEPDDSIQALYEGEVADSRMHSPPDKYRQRRFGGSTSIWGGRCMPFDPIDFERRSYIPDSGWPIAFDDVLPYYQAANKLVEAGRFSYDARQAFGPDAPPLIRGFESDIVSSEGIERFSRPTRFADRYGDRLANSPDVKLLLGANCTAIRLDSHAKRVRAIEIATLEGRKFTVIASDLVLAVGGLEAARLLLASRDVSPSGIGNENDVVGRYYMCHIAGNLGSLTVKGSPANVRHGYEVSPDGIYCRRRININAAEQRRLGLANMIVRLHFPRITDPSHRSGVLSGLFMARRLISYEYGKRLNDGVRTSMGSYLRHLANIVTGPFETIRFLWHWVTERMLATRKFPSIVLQNRTNRFSLDVHGEQFPLRESRVTLSDKVDALGVPRIRVDWHYSPSDIESVRRSLDVMSAEFERSGVATLSYDSEKLEDDLMLFGAYGGHHIGTTRMGDDPKTSVVDGNCKVHSVDNLFVAGSAVFPTSSQANPTLTLVALALRLAKHLADKHSAEASEKARPVMEGSPS